MSQKIRIDLELDTAKALFELIHEVINSKRVRVRKIPLNKIALAMLGVNLADKIHGNQVVARIQSNTKSEPMQPLGVTQRFAPDRCVVCNQVDCICGS